MMFYKKLVPINRETHRNLRLKPLSNGFSFAAKENALLALSTLATTNIDASLLSAAQAAAYQSEIAGGCGRA